MKSPLGMSEGAFFFRGFSPGPAYNRIERQPKHRPEGSGAQVWETVAALLRQKDPAGMEALLLHYGPLMRYIIAPILPDGQDAEECLSEAALRVWERAERFDPARGSWTAWLTAVTRNAALDRRRALARAPQTEELADTLPSPEPTPEEQLLRKERQAQLERALSRLSHGDRRLVYRKYYYMQSTAQIAAELGLSERAVEGRLYRLKNACGLCWEGNTMADNSWKSMDDRAFESALADSVPPQPPSDVADGVTPWKRAVNQLLAGTVLTSITIRNFLGLHLILPAVGIILLLLGFRALRRENRWFTACLALAAVCAALRLPGLILSATLLRPALETPPLSLLLGWGGTAARLALYFCLWLGLRAVGRKAGQHLWALPALALFGWYVLITVLAVTAGGQSVLLVVASCIGFVLILYCLYSLTRDLAETGYGIRPAAIRLSDRWLALLLAGAVAASCVLGGLLGSRYPMVWAPAEDTGPAAAAVRQRLEELGFPAYVLDDLTDEDILACDGALETAVTMTAARLDGSDRVSGPEAMDIQGLRITAVAVRLPGDAPRYRVFRHFLWTADPGFCGTEAIRLVPPYLDQQRRWDPIAPVSGQVLCGRDGQTYAAPFHLLGEDPKGGDPLQSCIWAAFSVPAGAERCRGYVSYCTEEIMKTGGLADLLNYYHQKTLLQYPAQSALEYARAAASSWGGSGGRVFQYYQGKLELYYDEHGITEVLP